MAGQWWVVGWWQLENRAQRTFEPAINISLDRECGWIVALTGFCANADSLPNI